MIWYAHDEVKTDSTATTTATESGQPACQEKVPTLDIQEALEQDWVLSRILI